MKKLKILSAYLLAFALGVVLSAYVSVRYYAIPMLEDIFIRGNSMEAYKAVSTLELLRNGKTEKAAEFLEWQLDDGLISLSKYTSSQKMQQRLDDFAVLALHKSRSYRLRHPRDSGFDATDSTVVKILNSDVAMRENILTPISVMDASPVPLRK